MKIPVIDKIAARISLKIQQLDVIVETKTLDDVFVKIKVSVQFVVIKDKVYDAILNSENFVAFNLTERIQLIGGTWYGGEMKKGMFSMMNYFLLRSEERRVGKECRSRWSPYH